MAEITMNCSEYAKKKVGNLVDTNGGKVLGQHEGIWNYTIGQRKRYSGISAPEPL